MNSKPIYKSKEEVYAAYTIATTKEYNEVKRKAENRAGNRLSDKGIRSKMRRIGRLRGE